jgi:hypothetical protein
MIHNKPLMIQEYLPILTIINSIGTFPYFPFDDQENNGMMFGHVSFADFPESWLSVLAHDKSFV